MTQEGIRLLRTGSLRKTFSVTGLLTGIGLILLSCSQPECPPVSCDPLELDSAGMQVEITEMLKTVDTLDRHRRLVQLMDAIDDDNLQGAIDAYDENTTRVDPHEARVFANRWARIDPHGAVEGILAWNFPRIKNQAVLEAVFVWAANDGDDARAYVDPLFEGNIEARQSPTKFMILAVLQGLGVAQEWDKLTEMLGSHPDDADRELWMTQVMIEITRASGMEGVRAWVNSIPWDAPHDLKVSALKRGLHWAAGTGGENAAAWYEEFEDEPGAIELMPMAVQTWGIREPTGAIDWLLKRQSTTVRDALLREIFRSWLTREGESETAEAWILANIADNETIARAAVIVYANYLIDNTRFLVAAETVQKYVLEEHHDKALIQVLLKWAGHNPAEASAYAEEKNLSDDIVVAYERRLKEKVVRVQKSRKLTESEVGE